MKEVRDRQELSGAVLLLWAVLGPIGLGEKARSLQSFSYEVIKRQLISASSRANPASFG